MKRILPCVLLISLIVNILFITFLLFFKDNGGTGYLKRENVGKDQINSTGIVNSDVYSTIHKSFTQVDSEASFNMFGEKYGASVMYFLSLAKLQEKSLWDKYSKYLYINNDLGFSEEDFMKKLDSFYNSEENILKQGEDYLDLEIIFSSNDLESSQELCITVFSGNDDRINSCKDNLYFYRSTLENNYCDLLFDPYRKEFCSSFYSQK